MRKKQNGTGKAYGIRAITGMVLQSGSTLLCFEMLYRGIGFSLFFPLIRYLLSQLPGLTGQPYLDQGKALLVLHHPLALMLLIGILMLAGFFIYFEIVALFLYAEKGWQRERISLWGLFREAAARTSGLLQPDRLPVFLLLPAIMLSVFSLMSGYLQNWQIPEFLLDYLMDSPSLLAAFITGIVLIHLLLLAYLFGFPSLLFENISFAGSFHESRRLLHKKAGHFAGKLCLYFLLFCAAEAVLILAGVLLLAGGLQLFYDTTAARNQFALYFSSFRGIWQLVSGALTSVFLCAAIVAIYHQTRGDTRLEAQPAPRPVRRILLRAAAIVCTSILLLLFSESEMGGMLWHPRDTPMDIVAHRAGGATAPENTIAALQNAIADGAAMVEMDVQQLRDGTLIVMHDSNFKRTTGWDRDVWAADYRDVRQLDAGALFSARYTGEPIPTLEDFLIAAKDRIRLMIELKSTGHERQLEAQTLAMIDQYDMRDQCVIASMDMDILKQVKELAPSMQTVYISVLLLTDHYDLQELDAYSVETTVLSSGMVIQAHLQGKQVYAWTANSTDTIRKILRCGADGVVTDNPTLAALCIRDAQEDLLLYELIDFLFPESTVPAA